MADDPAPAANSPGSTSTPTPSAATSSGSAEARKLLKPKVRVRHQKAIPEICPLSGLRSQFPGIRPASAWMYS